MTPLETYLMIYFAGCWCTVIVTHLLAERIASEPVAKNYPKARFLRAGLAIPLMWPALIPALAVMYLIDTISGHWTSPSRKGHR